MFVGLTLSLLLSSISYGQDDPFLWLEDIWSEQSMNWVRGQNEKTDTLFKGEPSYQEATQDLSRMFYEPNRIAWPEIDQGMVYNFWKDQTHPQGIWRRTTLEDYRKPAPTWEVLLDVDALSQKEKTTWVWTRVVRYKNSQSPLPHPHVLIVLSQNGSDTSIIREFDLETKAFVKDGFEIPPSKSEATWLNPDCLLVADATHPSTQTLSGYPRVIRKWKRGTPLQTSPIVFEGNPSDVEVSGVGSSDPFFIRMVTFHDWEIYSFGQDEMTQKVLVPKDSRLITIDKKRLYFFLRSPVDHHGVTLPEGTIIAKSVQTATSDKSFEVLFTPNEKHSLPTLFVTENEVFINVLENVQPAVYRLTRREPDSKAQDVTWHADKLNFPAGSFSIASQGLSDPFFVLEVSDFLTPSTLYLISENFGKNAKDSLTQSDILAEGKHWMDSSHYERLQAFATSKDGTQVPYFVVRKKLPGTKTRPALMTAYGGFLSNFKPHYLAYLRKWFDQGGIYVSANIRGGGEYGPKWHQAALREKRQNAIDDFIAIAEDLIQKNMTSPDQLGIMGGSNGGLLVGNVAVQRPDLFNAVACSVPLLDMLRYHTLLAGASWVAEYGDPENAADREFLLRLSPYHQLSSTKKVPHFYLTTSTADDRVHPGHARKMAAKMETLGYPFYYYENIAGGHSAAANYEQAIAYWARILAYFHMRLK